MTAQEKLKNNASEGKFICVGLDTDIEKIPNSLRRSTNPILEFNRKIIEATSEFTAAYKFNLAFYEKEGARGLEALFESIRLVPAGVLVIGDGKRGDIGNTSQKYAEMLYREFNFDSATLNPYMGKDSLEPFLAYKSKLNFILTLTSNDGAADFEKLKLSNNLFLYQEVINKVKSWNSNSNCGLVFGATKIGELENNMNIIGDLPVLLPGVGAQGGNLTEVVSLFKQLKLTSFLINVSRGIIYKSSFENFADEARNELLTINNIVNSITTA